MPCDCCSTVACCNGSSCEEKTKSQCATAGGTTTASCASLTCVDDAGEKPCTQENACSCAAKGKRTINLTTCNCSTLAASVAHGGCRPRYCEVCDERTGSCVSVCYAPRQCCEGTCCPIEQRCTDGECVNKCGTGTTFCQGNFTAYTCCQPNQKCCGAEGCQPRSTTSATVTVTIDVGQDAWVDTGVTIPNDTTVIITATGGASGPGNTAPISSSPNGTSPVPPESAFSECKVKGSEPLLRLIGEVGGAPFSVGASYSGKPGSGALRLRANSTCTDRFTGSYEAEVRYVTNDPCPDYAPASVGDPVVFDAGAHLHCGPGSELKALLRQVGIVASQTCSCNARAAQMDVWGERECLKRIPEICGWLKEEAEKRDLWFFPPAGAALILAAISLSALKRPFRGNSK